MVDDSVERAVDDRLHISTADALSAAQKQKAFFKPVDQFQMDPKESDAPSVPGRKDPSFDRGSRYESGQPFVSHLAYEKNQPNFN